MAKAVQIAIPSNASVVTLTDEDGDVVWGDELSLRNTGSVKVLLGGSDGVCLMPLGPNASDNDLGEFLGISVAQGEALTAKVKTPGTAGQITVLKAK